MNYATASGRGIKINLIDHCSKTLLPIVAFEIEDIFSISLLMQKHVKREHSTYVLSINTQAKE
jgi:hypothetical protein